MINKKGENNPNWKGGTKYINYNCDLCGKHKKGLRWNYLNSKNHFCSRKCQGEWYGKKHIGENNPNFKNRTVKYCCDYCGKECSSQITEYQKYEFHFCSRLCDNNHRIEHKRFSLENNGMWKGGKSFEPYTVEWNEELRVKIRERDNFICAICNNKGKDVHHIDYDKSNCDENNLIILCKKCHSMTNHNRDKWQSYFKENIVWEQ